MKLQIGPYAEASFYHRENLRRFQALGENRSVAYGLNMLGNLTFKQGEAEKALQDYRQGLSIALDLQAAPLILAILAGLTNLLKQQPHMQAFANALLTYHG